MNNKKQVYTPKHVQAGQAVGLEMDVNGTVFINLDVLNEEEGLSEKVRFIMDTGFNGYLQLSEDIITKLNLNIIKKSKSRGFDGREVEVGILSTKVRLLSEEVSGFPIQVVKKGALLIGTKFLKDTNKMIIFNYANGIIHLTGDKKVQKKVHKAVDKYST